ncbi:glycosyltransferase [Aurantimonas sp. A2-1-M11]|uniref:glycosyltransferase family 2 protein n=1 Tax=Aurantimonas sp. A2-1-M11 TaxID=3113712 RepID=UPI002F91FD40
MKLAVVVPSLGRRDMVGRLVTRLECQHRPPDEVVISAPDETHVGVFSAGRFPVSLVFGPKGLCAQRNSALARTLDRFDVVTFFDDDFVPADSYLQRVVEAFDQHDDWAVVMGEVVKDGARTDGLDWAMGLEALRLAELERPPPLRLIDHVGAYGCNMSIRSRMVGSLRFDERLPLYGWQEDIDFTSQLRRRGRVVSLSTIRGVHLGLKTGRVSGKRFGYSQVANPVYLIRKGTVPASFALPLMARNIAANIIRSVWSEPYVDRRGRLRGNLLALRHLLDGRVEPEHILEI